MARPNPTIQSYETIMSDLKKGTYKPIYLLVGTESYFIDKICNYILENALREEERDFNQIVLYGADTSMRQVLEQARRFPMMAERQVVVLREAQSAAEFGLIEKYIEKIVPTTVLVICANGMKLDKRKKYVGLANANGVVFESTPLRDYEMPSFAEQYVKHLGGSIDAKSCSMICEAVGTDLNRLVSEINKVMMSFQVGAPKSITPQLVEKCVGISNEFNGFELRDAIIRKDVYKVNLIVTHLMKNPKSGGLFKILPSLFNYFQNLMLAYYAPEPRNAAAVAGYLGLSNEWAAKAYLDGMRNYTAMKTIQIINKFREIDCKSKGLDNPSTSPEDLAQELVFYILH